MNNNEIRNKVKELLKGWQEEWETWETKEGKIIPYIRFSKDIDPDNDDWNRYQISVTVWQKNISVEITEYCGECGPEIDSDERWSMSRTFRIAKVPHAEFLERSNELIESATNYLYQNFNP